MDTKQRFPQSKNASTNATSRNITEQQEGPDNVPSMTHLTVTYSVHQSGLARSNQQFNVQTYQPTIRENQNQN